MKRYRAILLLVLLIFTSSHIIAQARIDTIYYDNDWVVVPHKAFANYYRVALYPSNLSAKKLFRDYYITGELQGEGSFVSIGIDIDVQIYEFILT